jgi:hypothetical protein
MRTTAFLMGGLIAATLGAKAYADDTKANNEKFCDAMTDFRADLKRLDAVGPNSTLAELRAASERVSASGQKVEKAQAKLDSPAAKEFRAATMKLRSDAKMLPDSTTIAEAKTKLAADIMKVKEASKKVTTEAGCPAPDMGTEPDKQNQDMGKPE